MQNVVSISDRDLPLVEGNSEKQIQDLARLGRKLRRQESRIRETIKKLETLGVTIEAKNVDTGKTAPVSQIEFTFLKLTK